MCLAIPWNNKLYQGIADGSMTIKKNFQKVFDIVAKVVYDKHEVTKW